MFKFFISLVFLFTSFAYADPHVGVVKSYSQQSDWKKQEHKVYMEFTLDGEEKVYSIAIDLSIDEMIAFSAEVGMPFMIINELPGALIFQSRFQLQLGENAQVYEGKGSSIDLKVEDWGVDEDSFMVTEVSLPLIVVNGAESLSVHSITGDLVGQIFSRNPIENFIPNKPGMSTFTHYSLDGESCFTYEASSKSSHWWPSTEQMENLKTVIGVRIDRYGSRLQFEAAYVTLSDERFAIPFYPFNLPNRFIEAGDRLIEVEGGWIDLDASLVIKKTDLYEAGFRYIVLGNSID